MKKVIRLAAIAIVAMAMTTACNNNAEEAVDTTPVADTIDTTIVDSAVIDTPVVEEETPAPAKKATVKKKEEPKVTVNTTPTAEGKKGITISNGKTNLTVTKGENGMKADVNTNPEANAPKTNKLTIKKN